MKYPQLVSDRAVSTISDWLITRLEVLGVEAPIVYSRLLLSLLHTPLQVDSVDLADIPQLKVGGEEVEEKHKRRRAEAVEFVVLES